MLLTAVTAEGVENSYMGCIYLKIASAALKEVLECAWEGPLAWGLMQQGALSLEVVREEMLLWRDRESGMESRNNRSQSLSCIYFVYIPRLISYFFFQNC